MKDIITLDAVKANEEQFITDIIEMKGENLPAKIEDVIKIFEFTDWKAKAWKTLADKMTRLDEQSEAYHSALRSGQQWGIAALYAQKRMGEITREMPKPSVGGAGGGAKSTLPSSSRKEDVLLQQGIQTRAYKEAERIASHPEILDEVIRDAEDKKEIPTKTAVLNRIKQEKQKNNREEYDRRKAKNANQARAIASAEVQKYMSDLMRVVNILPAEPPAQGWNEELMNEARGYAKVICNRLGRFFENE